MEKRTKLLLGLELVWWLFTALAVYLVMNPINKAIYQFEFKTFNIVLVVLFVTLVRYTFLLKYTFLAKKQFIKAALMIGCILAALLVTKELNAFLGFIEDYNWEPLTGHLPTENGQRASMETYIWNEMVFFSVGSIVACIAFAGRLLMSIWRTHNLDTV